METIFENQNTMSREQMRDVYKYLYIPAAKKAAIIQSIGAAFIGIAAVWLCFDLLMIALTVWLIVLAVRNYKEPEKKADEAYEKRLAYYDDVMAVTRTRFAEKIYIEVGNTTDVVEYRKIDKVVSLKNAYVIFTKAPGKITLSRNGFTKGTFEEFKQFLREKRPDLKIPE